MTGVEVLGPKLRECEGLKSVLAELTEEVVDILLLKPAGRVGVVIHMVGSLDESSNSTFTSDTELVLGLVRGDEAGFEKAEVTPDTAKEFD